MRVFLCAFPDIPRIDVHTHVSGDMTSIGYYHIMREIIIAKYGEDLARNAVRIYPRLGEAMRALGYEV